MRQCRSLSYGKTLCLAQVHPGARCQRLCLIPAHLACHSNAPHPQDTYHLYFLFDLMPGGDLMDVLVAEAKVSWAGGEGLGDALRCVTVSSGWTWLPGPACSTAPPAAKGREGALANQCASCALHHLRPQRLPRPLPPAPCRSSSTLCLKRAPCARAAWPRRSRCGR